MWKKSIKPVLAIIIFVSTIIFFIYYFESHQGVRQQLSHLSLVKIVFLVLLYMLTMLALTLVNISTLRLIKVRASVRESILLTAYTAVVNFFGPLQSGPAARAVYLKKKHRVDLKKYTLATLVYYFFWAAISGVFLLSGLLKWWLIPILVIGLTSLYLLSKKGFMKRKISMLSLKSWYLLALATFAQISIITVIYFIELRSVAPATHFAQAVIYTGAANFALFVSITPGALGFRESFLVFSNHLHHISNSSIVAANIIDRSVYLVVLIILAVIILLTHASKYLGIKESEQSNNA